MPPEYRLLLYMEGTHPQGFYRPTYYQQYGADQIDPRVGDLVMVIKELLPSARKHLKEKYGLFLGKELHSDTYEITA